MSEPDTGRRRKASPISPPVDRPITFGDIIREYRRAKDQVRVEARKRYARQSNGERGNHYKRYLDNHYGTLDAEYDGEYRDRPDFRLWRLFVPIPGVSCKRHKAVSDVNRITHRLAPLLEECLQDPCPVYVWGGLTVVAFELTKFWWGTTNYVAKCWLSYDQLQDYVNNLMTPEDRADAASHLDVCQRCRDNVEIVNALAGLHEQLQVVMRKCSEVLKANLKPLRPFFVESKIIRLLLESGVELVAYHTSHGQPHAWLGEAEDWVRKVEKGLMDIDPRWRPGKALSLDAIDEGRSMLPFRKHEICSRLGDVLFRARGMVRNALRGYPWGDKAISPTDEIVGSAPPQPGQPAVREIDVEGLLGKVADFALSSWRIARSIRIAEEQWHARNSKFLPHRPLEDVDAAEIVTLRKASQAQRDAGQVLEAARLAHLTLWMMDGNVSESAHARRLEGIDGALADGIKQLGLKIPVWAVEKNCPTSRVAPTGPDVDTAPGNAGHPTPRPRRHQPKVDIPDPYFLRMGHDQLTGRVPEWAPVLGRYPLSPGDRPDIPLKRVQTDLLNGGDVSTVASSAFQLCLRYGRVKDASDLFDRFATRKRDLLDFAYTVKRALQVMPYGADLVVHRRWQDQIRDHFARLSGDTGFSADEVLALHEILTGRGAAAMRYSGSARQLAERYYRTLTDESKIRAEYADDRGLLRSGPGLVNLDRLQQCLAEWARGGLGPPVLISLVRLSSHRWSILVVSCHKEPSWDHVDVGCDLLKQADRIARFVEPGYRVPWGAGFRRLSERLKEMVSAHAPEPKWLALAVDPGLAAIPWQQLLGSHSTVVSLIPSLTWLTLTRGEYPSLQPRMRLIVSNEDKLIELYRHDNSEEAASKRSELFSLRSLILASDSQLRARYPFAAFILGHGTWLESEQISSIVAPHAAIPLSDPTTHGYSWLDLASSHYQIVVHACYGGRTNEHLLGDLAGLPGMALALGCRLYCSPITEVTAKTVARLHNRLVDQSGGRTFGERYLRAVSEDDSVTLYTLYGFPDEAVLDPRTG